MNRQKESYFNFLKSLEKHLNSNVAQMRVTFSAAFGMRKKQHHVLTTNAQAAQIS